MHVADDSGKNKKAVKDVGIRETLQEALVNANNERHACHNRLQDCDHKLVLVKADLEKAKAHKSGADEINDRAIKEHQALIKFAGAQSEPSVRDALYPEINRLGVEQNIALRNAIRADTIYRQKQSECAEVAKERIAAQNYFDTATNRWEEIRKQINAISVLNEDA